MRLRFSAFSSNCPALLFVSPSRPSASYVHEEAWLCCLSYCSCPTMAMNFCFAIYPPLAFHRNPVDGALLNRQDAPGGACGVPSRWLSYHLREAEGEARSLQSRACSVCQERLSHSLIFIRTCSTAAGSGALSPNRPRCVHSFYTF